MKKITANELKMFANSNAIFNREQLTSKIKEINQTKVNKKIHVPIFNQKGEIAE